jgi:flagellar hook assembly protein FlgD
VLGADATVSVKVYDVSGEKLRDFDPVFMAQGAHEAYWDLRNAQGQKVASGVYLVKFTATSPSGEVDEAWTKVAVIR